MDCIEREFQKDGFGSLDDAVEEVLPNRARLKSRAKKLERDSPKYVFLWNENALARSKIESTKLSARSLENRPRSLEQKTSSKPSLINALQL